MIVILGLIILLAAVIIGVAGVLGNRSAVVYLEDKYLWSNLAQVATGVIAGVTSSGLANRQAPSRAGRHAALQPRQAPSSTRQTWA